MTKKGTFALKMPSIHLAPRGEKTKAGCAFVIRVFYSLSAYCRSRDGGSAEAESEHSGSKYSASA